MGTLVSLTRSLDTRMNHILTYYVGTKRFYEMNKMTLPEGYEKQQ